MTKIGKCILLFQIILSLSSCQRDFDPQRDSTVCTAYFNIDVRHCFRYVVSHDGTYSVGMPDSLSPGYYLRISGFCYDSNNRLVRQKECLYDSIGVIPFTIDYVDSLRGYNFCFVADFVRDDSQLNNFGSWYFSCENNYETLYANFSSSNTLPQYNTLLYAACSKTPNHPISLSLHPLTYGGYVRFLNISNYKKVSYSFSKHYSFSLLHPSTENTFFWNDIENIYPSSAMSEISIPITRCEADSRLGVDVKTSFVNNFDGDSAKYHVFFNRCSPFLITIDCANFNNLPTIQYLE